MKGGFNFNHLKDNKWLWLSFYAIILSVVIFRNISNSGIDHEEAGQFWMAKGLNHFSDLGEPDGNISELINNNRIFNLDPGGFTLLLRFWTGIFGNSIVSLRFLPFLFLLISAVTFRSLLNLFSFNKWIVNLSPLLFLLSKDLISFGFTVRAYSFEICGIILSLYFLSQSVLYYKNRHLIYLFMILSIFAFSRYGFFIEIGACLVLLLASYIKRLPILFNNKIVVSGFLILGISLSIIYYFSLQYQLKNTNFHGPEYAYLKTLKGQASFKDGLEIFFANFTKLRIIPFSILILIVIFGIFIKKIPQFGKYKILLSYFLIYTILAIFLSIVGLYPWDVTSRNSLPFQFFSILSICILLDWSHQFISLHVMNFIALGLIIIVTSISFIRGYIRYDYSSLMYEGGENSKDTWVDWMIYPVLKYNIKYGTLKNFKDLHYPSLSNDTFKKNYKYLVIDMEPKNKEASLKRYGIENYKVLKNVENDYLIEILK